jgi:hypothetical protein
VAAHLGLLVSVALRFRPATLRREQDVASVEDRLEECLAPPVALFALVVARRRLSIGS